MVVPRLVRVRRARVVRSPTGGVPTNRGTSLPHTPVLFSSVGLSKRKCMFSFWGLNLGKLAFVLPC